MKKSKNSANFILEIFWLTIFILTLAIGIINFAKTGWESAKMFFIMALLAFLLYLARRHLRKKNQANPS